MIAAERPTVPKVAAAHDEAPDPDTARPQSKLRPRTAAIAATGVLGALAAGIFGALKLGWLDRALVRPRPGSASTPCLISRPTPAHPGTERAPVAFRPDPAPSPTPSGNRSAPPPAPRPTLAAQRGEMANQTGASNG
ncbi:hypothetical protein AB5I41_27370 [Sphingomonas sp. MMS24-JH45]